MSGLQYALNYALKFVKRHKHFVWELFKIVYVYKKNSLKEYWLSSENKLYYSSLSLQDMEDKYCTHDKKD